MYVRLKAGTFSLTMNKANNLQAIFIVHISYIPYVEKKKNTEKKREREGKVSVSYKKKCWNKIFVHKLLFKFGMHF